MRELSDPDVSQAASQMVMQGVPGQVAPRGPIKPTPPDSGPPIGMPMNPGSGTQQMYIPGGSVHDVVYCDPGENDTVQDYPVGVGAWQSRSHGGHVPQTDGPDGTTGSSKPVNKPAVPTVSVIGGA